MDEENENDDPMRPLGWARLAITLAIN